MIYLFQFEVVVAGMVRNLPNYVTSLSSLFYVLTVVYSVETE